MVQPKIRESTSRARAVTFNDNQVKGKKRLSDQESSRDEKTRAAKPRVCVGVLYEERGWRLKVESEVWVVVGGV